jgi:DNA repair exonuclease SbcCD ATPase subunit
METVLPTTEEVVHAARKVIQQHERDIEELQRMKAELQRKIEQRDEIEPKIVLLEKVRVFMQTLAEATRDEIMSGLEHVVTTCLHIVFGPHLRFEIEVETKRNTTGIEFYLVDESGDKPVRLKPEGNMAGGELDTISIGLRFGLLKVLNPTPEGPVFLDEPAKMISGDRVFSIANLLKELSKMFDKQIIMVSHHEALIDVVDNSIYFKRENGVTVCAG